MLLKQDTLKPSGGHVSHQAMLRLYRFNSPHACANSALAALGPALPLSQEILSEDELRHSLSPAREHGNSSERGRLATFRV